MGFADRDGFRRGDRGRVRHPHHHEHAGGNRDCRPAGRRGGQAQVMSDAIDTAADAHTPEEVSGSKDLFSKFDPLIKEREALMATGVRDPFAIVMEKVTSPTRAVIKGKETILLGTYNYMGMTFDPDVIQAGKDALDNYGSGTTGSRVLNGTYQGHRECEDALKEFYGTSGAMVFSTGYQANLGVISTLAG